MLVEKGERHKTYTGKLRPIRQPARKLSLARREEVDRIINEMEADGVIEPSVSPW